MPWSLACSLSRSSRKVSPGHPVVNVFVCNLTSCAMGNRWVGNLNISPIFLFASMASKYWILVLCGRISIFSVSPKRLKDGRGPGGFSHPAGAMQLGFLHRVRVTHTASHEKGQIYIPAR
jgi:hypothetical protein